MMSCRTWTVGKDGGEIDLNENGSVVLRVPEGAFPRSTSVTWSLIGIQKDCPPTIDITATEDGKDTEIKIFSKYVEIIYKDIPTKNIGVKVEGGVDFPELQVPQQDMPFLLETTVAEASHREPENEISSQEPEEPSSTESEVQSIFHTFYSFSDYNTVTVHTRHFSRFNLYCKKHDTNADYDANISAVLFQKLEIVNDSIDVTVKVILDAENTRRGSYNPEFWRIQDIDQYRYMETIKLKGPPNPEIIQPGSQFLCYATVVGEEEYWEVSEKTQSEFLENCIPCRECKNEILPDAALIQFSSKKPDPPDFRAKFHFSLQLRRIGSFARLQNALHSALVYETPPKRVAIPVASVYGLQPQAPIFAVHQRNQEQFPAKSSVCVNGRIPDENMSANLPVEVDGTTDGVGSYTFAPAQSPKREDSGISLAPSDETDERIDSGGNAMSPDSDGFSEIRLEEINRRPNSTTNENPSSSSNQVTERKSLTGKQILNLSRFILNNYDILNLGFNLGVKEREIDAELGKKNDKPDAAHAVLKLWRRGQECPMQAYDTLCEALVKADLQYYAVQALGYKSPSSAS